ncbi:MAG: MerR family transcriptional regulator [Magnetococcales bacterium]|nr:MerR family transcriptional regulator [Magnetococcales bacterium]
MFPIRRLVEILKVPPETIRTWERRYRIFAPSRTTSGQRRYSPNDLEVAIKLRNYLDEGMGIKDATHEIRMSDFPLLESAQKGIPWDDLLGTALLAIRDFDQKTLDFVFSKAFSQFPEDTVMHRLVVPLFQTLGDNWNKHPTGIAEEHFARVYCLAKLGSYYNTCVLDARGKPVLVTTIPGEQHELGLLLFCLALTSQGYRPVYAGPNLPLSQCRLIIEKTNSVGIVLSGRKESLTAPEISCLADLVSDASVPVFIGGVTSERCRNELGMIGVIALGEKFVEAIRIINDELKQ